MTDIFNSFGDDYQLTQTGDFATVDDQQQTNQRILRRLMTNPGAYVWHPEYGAGVGQFVGQIVGTAKEDEIKALIISQMYLEATVAKFPEPDVTVNFIDLMNLSVSIKYMFEPSQELFTLSFTVGST